MAPTGHSKVKIATLTLVDIATITMVDLVMVTMVDLAMVTTAKVARWSKDDEDPACLPSHV